MSILTVKELKQAWKNYQFHGGEKVNFYIYEEKEIFGREIYKYEDKKGTHYLIINGINVLADVNACFCDYNDKEDFEYFLDPYTRKKGKYYNDKEDFEYFLDPYTRKKGKFDFKTNTFQLDL